MKLKYTGGIDNWLSPLLLTNVKTMPKFVNLLHIPDSAQ